MARGILTGLFFGVLVAALVVVIAALQLEARRDVVRVVMTPPDVLFDYTPRPGRVRDSAAGTSDPGLARSRPATHGGATVSRGARGAGLGPGVAASGVIPASAPPPRPATTPANIPDLSAPPQVLAQTDIPDWPDGTVSPPPDLSGITGADVPMRVEGPAAVAPDNAPQGPGALTPYLPHPGVAPMVATGGVVTSGPVARAPVERAEVAMTRRSPAAVGRLPHPVTDPFTQPQPPAGIEPPPAPSGLIASGRAASTADTAQPSGPVMAIVLRVPAVQRPDVPDWAQSIAVPGAALGDLIAGRTEVVAIVPEGADRGRLSQLAWDLARVNAPGPLLVSAAMASESATQDLLGLVRASGLGLLDAGGAGRALLEGQPGGQPLLAPVYPAASDPVQLSRAAEHARRDGAVILVLEDTPATRSAVSDWIAAGGDGVTLVTAAQALARLSIR